MFKNVDEKLKDLGFVKVENESKYGACYMRAVSINSDDSYIHRLDILHKASGNHII